MILLNGCASSAIDCSTSFFAAKLVASLTQPASHHGQPRKMLALSYFCRQHQGYYIDPAANPREVAMSLLLQLIDQFREFDARDLDKCRRDTTPGDLGTICTSLERLIHRLPAEVIVFLIIEGIQYFTIPPERNASFRELLHHLVHLYRSRPGASKLKFMFLSSTKGHVLKELLEDEEIMNIPQSLPPMGPTPHILAMDVLR